MRKLYATALVAILVTGAILFSCKKKHDQEPLVITPTVTPIPYSVMAYLVTPTDKQFNPDYYRAIKAALIHIQSYYKDQLGKTFTLNPVVVDTVSALHNSAWFTADNGPAISGTAGVKSYHNTVYEMTQLLGSRFDTSHITYAIWVVADFPDETIPHGLAAEGMPNITGLIAKYPNAWRGAATHALSHAFGITDHWPADPTNVMSDGYPHFPDCSFNQSEKDSLNTLQFLK